MEFKISYNKMMKALTAPLGMGARFSGVTVEGGTVRARMGPYFSTEFDLSQIRSAERIDRIHWWWGQGVHSWRGTSVVNGSNRGLVRVELDPPARARAPFDAKLEVLIVSLEEPDQFLEALSSRDLA